MGSAGTGSSFVDNRGEFSSAAGTHRLKRVRQLVATVAVALFSSAFLSSCSGFFIKPTISSIYITPAAATIGVGQMTSFTAYATYSDGTQNQISGDSVGWTSSATNIASVTSPGGSVTGVALGTATITASAQGITGTATVNVTVSNITSLVITTHPGKHPAHNHGDHLRNVRHLAVLCLRQWERLQRRDPGGNLEFVEHERGDHRSGGTSGNGVASAVSAGTTNITASTTNTSTGQLVNSQTIVLTVTQ